MSMGNLHIEGTVETILFKSKDTGYIVLELDCGGEPVTVVGELGDIGEGEMLKLEGYYEVHKKFGNQFKAVYCEKKFPSNSVNIEKYLASGAIKGIGAVLAKRIVSVFGDKTFDILERSPQRLMEVKGISPKKCRDIAVEAQKLFSLRILTAFLADYDVKAPYAMKLYQKFGTGSVDAIKLNPYILCDESVGLDFDKADAIARSLDFEHNCRKRIYAGTEYILRKGIAAGHSCLPVDSAAEITASKLEISEEDFFASFRRSLESRSFVSFEKNGREYAYIPEYYRAEKYISERIKIMKEFSGTKDINCIPFIIIEEEDNDIRYEKLQRKAIETAIKEGLVILTGGPGTGKTTTLNAVISIFQKIGERVMLAAPTGRAAKRLSDITGCEAKTVHRLLEVSYSSDSTIKFVHNEQNPLDCDVLVIDEMSMVDVILFENLLRALRLGCKLIMVGDSNQLPSVGAGNLLEDMIKSKAVTVIELKEIFRQAKESTIITNAHRIVSGQYPDLTRKDSDFFFFRRADYEQAVQLIVDLAKTRLPKAYDYSPLEDIQIITPSRKGMVGSVELNRILQEALNPASELPEYKCGLTTYRISDKVMQTKNNYDIDWIKDDERGKGVFNGDIGIIIKIDKRLQHIVIDYDGRFAIYPFELISQVELAYAITVHKSQGCEFEAVIMPVMGGFEKLSYRKLLYTAVTRAKKLLILVGTEDKIKRMVDNDKCSCRFTCLQTMLADGEDTDDPFSDISDDDENTGLIGMDKQ